MPDIAQLSIQVNASDVQNAQQSLDRLSTSGQNCEGVMGVLEKAAVRVAEAFAAWEVLNKMQESIMSYARYETLGVAMEQIGRNAGYSAMQMAHFQDQLQATGISMMESRNNLTRMAAAQLDLNKASELARVAQDAAVVAGINSSEAFERLVQGIVSGQPRILHTMGIFADFKGVEESLAKAHGETSKELTTAEAAQARMNAVLDEGAKRAGAYEAAMGTAGKQITSMQRYIDNLEVQFGETFGPALTTVIAATTDTLKDASKALKDWKASGEMGMEQAHLKNEVLGFISVLSSGTQFVYSHRDAILVLGAALAGIKLADVVKSMGQWAVAQRNAALEGVIAARADVEAATQKALVAQANILESNTLIRQAEAKQAATIATNELSNAEARLAEEESASAIAGGIASKALTSVGGVFGVITMAITGAAMAWSLFHDKMNENSKDAITSAEAEIAATEKKIKAIRDYYNHTASKTDVANALNGPDEDPAVKALDKQFGELQVKWVKLHKQMEGIFGSDIGKTAVASQELLDTENQINSILEKRQKLVEDLNNFKLLQDKFQNEQGGKTNTGQGQTTEYRDTEYGREVNRLQEELLKLTVSEREAFEMKLKLMDNGKSGNVDEALGLYDQIEAYKKWAAEQKTAQQEGANLQNTLMGLKDAYDKVALSDSELLAIQLRDQGADEEAVQNALDLTAATKALNDQKQAEKRINDEVARLNTKDDYATRMAHVQDLLNHGLNTESYQKEMHKLLLESQTLWGDTAYVIENSADRSSEALANFFNGTKTGFRSMVSDMLIEIEKLYIKQKLVSPLFQWISGLNFNFGGEDTTISSGGSGIGMNPTGSGSGMGGSTAPVFSGASMGNTTNQTSVTVHVHQDGSSTSQVSSSQGADLGKLLSGKVQDEIRKQMQPGGLLNRKN